MKLFEKAFKKILEDVTAGADGAFGQSTGHGGSFETSDWYAPGDYRVPFALGAKKKRKATRKTKRKATRKTKRKSKRKSKKNVFLRASYTVPVATRVPPELVVTTGMQGPSEKSNIGFA